MGPNRSHRALFIVALYLGVGFLTLIIGSGTSGGEEKASAKAKGYLQEGLRASNKGRLPEAVQAFKEASTIDPDNPFVFNYLGVAYMRMGRFRDAIDPFEKAVALRPTSATFQFNLARAYQLTKNFPKALEHYQNTVDLNPAQALAHLYLGKLYGREQERYPEAIEELTKSIALNVSNAEAPFLSEAHYLLAVAYFGVKNFTLAWQSVEEAERLGYKVNPAFTKALSQMAPKSP